MNPHRRILAGCPEGTKDLSPGLLARSKSYLGFNAEKSHHPERVSDSLLRPEKKNRPVGILKCETVSHFEFKAEMRVLLHWQPSAKFNSIVTNAIKTIVH